VAAAAGDDLTSLLGGHAVPEAMPALADDFARLIGALHDGSPQKKAGLAQKEPVLLSGGSGGVNRKRRAKPPLPAIDNFTES